MTQVGLTCRCDRDARQTDLAGALAAVRERYRGSASPASWSLRRRRHGSGTHEAGQSSAGPPVFAVGVGSAEGGRGPRGTGITAGDPRLDQASVDLHVSAVQPGFGREAVRAARARERPAAREPDADARGRRLADRGNLHRVARSAEPDGLHRRDRGGPWRGCDRETTRAACSSARRAGGAACSPSRARRGSSTAS